MKPNRAVSRNSTNNINIFSQTKSNSLCYLKHPNPTTLWKHWRRTNSKLYPGEISWVTLEVLQQ